MSNETPILQFLKSLPLDEPLYYFPNPGNAGDALIALAAFQLFARAGLDLRVVRDPQAFDPSGKIVIYGGGGNLVGHYDTARQIILHCYPRLERLVILPHTIQANQDLLAGFRENVDVICREPVSFAHVEQYAPRARVHLMDDLALQLEPKALQAGGPLWAEPVPLSWKLRDAYFASLLPVRLALGRGFRPDRDRTLNAFRKDIESSGRFPPGESADVATLFSHGTDSETTVRYVSRRLFQVIDRYRIVRTDRLHVCIAAALLGKRVDFYPNSYFKCEAVYNYSLRERFPDVRWMG